MIQGIENAPKGISLSIEQVEIERKGIQAFRGVGKSFILGGATVWVLLRDPDFKWLILSATSDRADTFSIFSKALIKNLPLLQHLQPRIGQKDSNKAWEVGPARVDQTASVKSIGILGAWTGSRANGIILDDIEISNNSDTPLKREKLSEAIKETDAVIKPESRDSKPWWRDEGSGVENEYYSLFEDFTVFLRYVWAQLGLPEPTRIQLDIARSLQNNLFPDRTTLDNPCNIIQFLGTPQSEDSVYSRLEERGYSTLIWPARYPDDKEIEYYGDKLAPIVSQALNEGLAHPGDPVDPQRFSDDDLNAREQSYGRAGFKLQFMLNTSLSDAEKYPLKCSDLIVTALNKDKAPSEVMWSRGPNTIIRDLPCPGIGKDAFYRPSWISDKDWRDYKGKMMYVDPSGRGKDETGWAISGFLNGNVFVLDFGGIEGGYTNDTMDYLLQKASDWGVNIIKPESNFGDGMFTELLISRMNATDIYKCTVEERKVTGQKELRLIDTLEPAITSHKVIVSEDALRTDYDKIPTHRGDKAPLYRLSYQLSRLQRVRAALPHDDRIEAFEGCVHHWLESLSIASNKQAEKVREQNWKKEVKNYMKNLALPQAKKTRNRAKNGWV